ncbi:MAG TPA: TonB-dependent receptor [Candidatus Acidoferrales bacterium]|nr:TonB-dependent receptor [Candidatus Acidoferrales bacterium]
MRNISDLVSRRLTLGAFLAVSLILAPCGPLHAQGQVQANVTGQVTDASKAAVPGAAITLLNGATGQTWKATTDAQGHFYISLLPVGTYRLTVEHSGFQQQVVENLTLGVGATVPVNLTLQVGEVSQLVQVTAQASVYETTNASTGSTIGSAQITDLPINGRDYARLSLLAPGAILRTAEIADLSFNGLELESNTFSIDGIDSTRLDYSFIGNGSERGARLFTGSMSSIGEFSIQTGTYGAQYARSAGAYINIVSKSGTNGIHGEVWEFDRNTSLDARNYFSPTLQPMHYNDFGANVGGPIWKNHMFYFLNYEGVRQSIGVASSSTVPSNLMRQEVLSTSPVLAPFIAEMPVSNNVLPGTGGLIALYTPIGASHVAENTGSARIDNRFTDNDSMFYRINLNQSLVSGAVFQIFNGSFGLHDGQEVPTFVTNMALGETHIFSPTLTNNILTGLQRYATTIDESLGTLPQLIIRKGIGIQPGNFGHYTRTPMSWQMGDTLTWVKGNHTVQAGGTVWLKDIPYNADPVVKLTYNSPQDFINNNLFRVTHSAGNPGTLTIQREFGLFLQDAWQVRPRLTATLGLRYDHDGVPYDEFHRTQSFNPVTGVLDPPGTPYFNENWMNFQPRVSIAWAPDKSNKWIMRTGYGIYYVEYPLGDAGFGSPSGNNLPGNFDLRATAGNPLSYPYDSFVSRAKVPPPSLYGFTKNAPNNYTEQWSFGVGRTLGPNTGILVNYVGNHSVNLERDQLTNWLGQIPADGINTIVGWDAQSNYNALQVSFKRQMSHGILYDFEYAWAHAIASMPQADTFGSYAENNKNIAPERGDSSNDTRQQFSYNLLWNLPIGRGHALLGDSSGFLGKIVSGWEFVTLGFFHTGLPASVYTFNPGADGNFYNQRANCGTGSSLYGNNPVPHALWNPAAFTDPTPFTFGTCPNSVVRGYRFAQTDFSLIKDTPWMEGRSIEFRAEFFNLFNHTNFSPPDQFLGDPTFGQTQSTVGQLIGSGTPRQIQLALKLEF